MVYDLAVAAASGHGRVADASPQNVSQSFPKLCRGTCLQLYQHLQSRVPARAKNGSAKASTEMRHPEFAYHELFIFAHVVRRRDLNSERSDGDASVTVMRMQFSGATADQSS